VTSWYDESADYHWDTQTEHDTTGHWTQGVWAKTRYVGCGYAACDDSTSPWGSGWNWFYVVCKYFPGGNYNGAQPYTEGSKCSECDADRTECNGDNGGLCGGGICLNCAADFFQNVCTYEKDTCDEYQDDGEVLAPVSSSTTSTPNRQRTLSSTTCAEPPYSGDSCSSSNPTGCTCTALTDDEKAEILAAHNDRRDLAASGNEDCATSNGASTTPCPAATDMNELLWDDGLEAVATYWAHQCDYGHHNSANPGEQNDMYQALCDDGDCLAVGYDGEWIGENLGVSGTSSSTPNWDIDSITARVTSWYDESADYHWDTQTEHDTTGHWTQGVWAKTRYVGCGYAACDDSTSPWGSGWNWFYVVCKYFPGGNYNGAQPYTEGSKCSDCDADRTDCNGGLCGGGICLNCAADFFQNVCTYEQDTCDDYETAEEVLAQEVVIGSDTYSDTDTNTDTNNDSNTGGGGKGKGGDDGDGDALDADPDNKSSVSWIGQEMSLLVVMLLSALAIVC